MKRKIIVFPSEQFVNQRPPRSLLKFNEWLKYIIQEIPVDYQGDATIDPVAKVSESSEAYTTIEIAYYREETDREKQKRLQEKAVDEERLLQDELAELKRLKAKYEG